MAIDASHLTSRLYHTTMGCICQEENWPTRAAGGTPRVEPGFAELASGRPGGTAGGFASCVTELGRSAGGARPSFGGRLIVGPSSPALDSVVVDDESISVLVVFVAGAKSLERMLIANAQSRRSAKSPIP